MATLVMDPTPRVGEVVSALRRHLRTEDVTVTSAEYGARTRIVVHAPLAELFTAACLYLDPLHIAWDASEVAAA